MTPRKLAICFAFLMFALVLGPSPAHGQDPVPAEMVLRTISLPRPVHFADSAGGDALVPAGAYWVGSIGEDLQLFSLETGTSYALRAATDQHAQRIDRSVALSTPGTEQQPDVHVVMFLLVGGTRLTAEGSYSGVLPRGLLDDAKKKAEAARNKAAAAALAAKEKARRAADEALARAKELVEKLRATLEGFMSLPCEQKIEVFLQAADVAAEKLQFGPERPRAENRERRRRILDNVVERALQKNPKMLWAAVQLMAAIRNGKQEERIEELIKSAACGTDPDGTQAEFLAIVNLLGASVPPMRADSKDAVQARSVPVLGSLFDGGGYSVSFDISISGAFPTSRKKAIGFGEGLGIAGGAIGNSPCPMPRGGNVGIRSYYYRYVGRSTLELGGGVPLCVSVWAVNPRDMAGRFTMVGATISAESIGALIAGGTGTATAASGGAAAPSLLATLVGFVGFGIDLTFDQSLASYIECVLEHEDTWAADCTELPNLLGVTVSGGFSASLAPVAAHSYGGAEWTWWWDPRVYDPQGPSPLFPVIKDFVKAKLSDH